MTQWVYGKNTVKQLLNEPGKIKQIAMAGRDEEILRLAHKANIPIKMHERKELTRLIGNDRHQSIAALIEPYKTYSVDEIVSAIPSHENGLLVMLDELEDPHNLGAILRTADAVGAHGVIFKKNNAVGLTPTVAKVSVGAIDTVKCASVTNLSRTLEDLKKKGWWVVGADMDGMDYRSLKYDFNVVLVIGNEGKGISRLVASKCDYIVSLPMRGQISSLNASVSAGVLMYEILSKRNPL